ncbi:MAG: 30S ribosomal protein S20 [bacterium]|jgi:small subunit ribosomal protein S20|nr:30S ribosomal protein S20 [bacterium]
MPNTASAKKSFRQSAQRRLVNISRKQTLKGTIKSYKKLVADKKTDEARKELATVYKRLDKAAKVNLIKKNTASRLKSRLSRLVRQN